VERGYFIQNTIRPSQELRNGRATQRGLALGEFAAVVKPITKSW